MNDLKENSLELKRYVYNALTSKEFKDTLQFLQIEESQKDGIYESIENSSINEFLSLYEKIQIIHEINKSIDSMTDIDNKTSANLIELLHLFDSDNLIKNSSKRTTANTIVNKP